MIHYHCFWSDFYYDPERLFQRFFEDLFGGIRLAEGKELRVCSVFNVSDARQLPSKTANEIRIAYSGEVFNLDPSFFDINLIMKADDSANRVVCLPLFIVESQVRNYWPRYMTSRPLAPKSNFCAFVVSNATSSVRIKFFQMLSQYKRVDSYGCALNNTGVRPPDRADHENYLAFLGKHKFCICFENNSNPWYLTEKLHNAWLGGTIPVYWGCTSAPKWLNPRAFLYLEDDSHDSMVKLVEKIKLLDTNDEAYMSIYREPLILSDKLPEVFNVENIRNKIRILIGDVAEGVVSHDGRV